MRRIVLLAMFAACGDPPPLALRFRVTPGSSSACFNTATPPVQVTSCADVQMLCQAVVSIRVVSPSDPTAPYISVCQQLVGQPNLCSIAGVDLPAPTQPIPLEDLEVQIAVFPYSTDLLDPTTGELQCPTDVQYDATGFPVTADEPCDPESAVCPVVPAVGGLAYYHPGDSETLVDLGCTDLTQLDGPMCTGKNLIDVTAAVDDFDTEVSVQASLADNLVVSIGEPIATIVGTETHYVLDTADSTPLVRVAAQTVPGWSADVDATFTAAECLEVFEDGAQTTAALVCQAVDPMDPNTIDMTGRRLAKTTLTDILGAISSPVFPDDGLVVGIVLDYLGNPIANLDVAATAGTVSYLSADRHDLIGGGTSSSGIFISEDAPFGTTFSATSSLHTVSNFGGLVDGKVTVVVLQFDTPVGD